MTNSLGTQLRNARVEHKLGLRELARRLEIAPSYLSDIENDRRTPAEQVLRRMAKILEVDFEEMMALGGRLGEETVRYVRDVPAAARLFRRITELRLDEQAIKKVEKSVESQA